MKKVIRQLSFALVMILVCAGMLQAVETVTGTRDMASVVIGGDTITYSIKIDVDESNLPNSILIEETLPDGWEYSSSNISGVGDLISTQLRINSRDISWLFVGDIVLGDDYQDHPIAKTSVEDTTITITARMVTPVCGDVIYDANIKYMEGATEQQTTVTGDTVGLVPYGDVNNDNKVNVFDVLAIARHLADLNTPVFNSVEADVDCNGNINVFDALFIAKYAVDLPNPTWCSNPCN